MRSTIARGLILACALMACDAFTHPLCGCSPSPSVFQLSGTLSTTTGAPAPGKRVRSEVAYRPCSDWFHSTSSVTDASGGYRMTLESGGSPDSVCARFFARDTALGSAEVTLPQTIRVMLKRFPSDSATLNLTIP